MGIQMLTRPPEELKEKLRRAAKQRGFTLNHLVLQILWDWANENLPTDKDAS